MLAASSIAANRTQVFAARQGVIRRIRRDRFALATGRCTQEVAVTTSIEGSLHAKQRERSSINLRRYDRNVHIWDTLRIELQNIIL